MGLIKRKKVPKVHFKSPYTKFENSHNFSNISTTNLTKLALEKCAKAT